MAWNFSLASSLGLTSGCHCLAAFLYACVRRGGAGQTQTRARQRARESARARKRCGCRARAGCTRAGRAGSTHVLDVLVLGISGHAQPAVVVGVHGRRGGARGVEGHRRPRRHAPRQPCRLAHRQRGEPSPPRAHGVLELPGRREGRVSAVRVAWRQGGGVWRPALAAAGDLERPSRAVRCTPRSLISASV